MSKNIDREILRNLRLARAVRAKTLQLLEGLSQDSLDRRPSRSGLLIGEKGNWSLGEHADHVLRVETYIRREIFEKLIEMARTEKRPVLRLTVADVNLGPSFIPELLSRPSEVFFDLNNRLSSLLIPRRLTEQFIRFSTFPSRTPKPWQPIRGRDGNDLLDELSNSLEPMEELFEENSDAEFQKMTFVHTIIGRHTLPQLVRIVSIHEEWHQDRMIELFSDVRLDGNGRTATG